MSVVLYALGAALLLWGGYVLLSGDMIATLDIAASLAGSGVFAIGLGAVAAAIKRLARVIAEQGVSRGAPAPDHDIPQRARDLPPLQELRRAAPATAAPAAPELEPRAEPTPAVKAEADLAAALERDLDPPPPPARRPRIEVAPARVPAPAPVASSAAAPSKAERRLRAREEARAEAESEPSLPIPAPVVVVPPVVAPILGGGFAANRAEAGSVPSPEPVAAPELDVAPEPPAEPVDVVVEPAMEATPEPETPVIAPEPKVPDWLARARARREARANAEAEGQAPPESLPVESSPVESAPAPEPDPVEPEPEREPADEPLADETPERVVLREGEHNGVLYRFFADGSVEAESEHGMRRFDSLEELRATVLAVRGHIEGEDEDDPAARPEAEMMVAPAAETPVGPATEEGAVAVEPALNPAGPDDDFEAALAALESGLGDDRPSKPAAPALDEVRPGRDR